MALREMHGHCCFCTTAVSMTTSWWRLRSGITGNGQRIPRSNNRSQRSQETTFCLELLRFCSIPYNASPESSTYVYRMPDRPYSLSEGLAGTICAWADACVVIQARLRKMDVGKHSSASIAATLKGDAHFQELENRKLGFPTLAYHRPAGLL